MGYSADRNSFWPDDDENTIYLENSRWITLFDIIYIARSKWPELSDLDALDSISISAENIHTDHLGHEFHYPSDYTNFIVITRNKCLNGLLKETHHQDICLLKVGLGEFI